MSVWRRAYAWLDDRLGISKIVPATLTHPIPKSSATWWYVWGSATLIAFAMQVLTGVVLAFAYIPAPNAAYESLQWITHEAVLGSVVRGIHYWGSSAMVVLVVIHTIRVYLTGSYKYPRELSWVTGVFLLLLTLALAFTGQLLRWNQDAYWAVVVAAEQAARVPFIGGLIARTIVAGTTVGGATLTRFYATHVFLLPALTFLLIGVHLYLVVLHGISEWPKPGQVVDRLTYRQRYNEMIHKQGVPFWPDAAWKDVVFSLAVGSLVLGLAIFLGPAELGNRADPTNIEAYPRPDWYFLWYFALLALVPVALEDWFMVGFPLIVGIILLALPFVSPGGERHPKSRPWAIAIVGFSVVAIGALVNLGDRAPWSPVVPSPELPQQVVTPLEGSAREGALIYQSYGCINCHIIGGYGGQRGPNLNYVGDRLRRDELIWRILYGGNGMPAYGGSLTTDQVNALVDFLETRRATQPEGEG